MTRRLNLLSRKPNLYLARPHQQRDCASANHRPLIYELDERAARVLRERGLSFQPKKYHNNFAHELMVAQIMASLELSTKEETHVRLISWPEILASSTTPKATRESQAPASIPVAFSIRGEQHALNLTADAHPFGLKRIISVVFRSRISRSSRSRSAALIEIRSIFLIGADSQVHADL